MEDKQLTEFLKMCGILDQKFLPTQEKIQQDIYRRNCDFSLLQKFYYWVALQRQERVEIIKRMNITQLWYMYYMYEDQEKEWDGEKWQKLKEL